MNRNIDFDNNPVAPINGITSKLVESAPNVFHREGVNPKDIPQDDLDEVILNKNDSRG